MGFRSRRANSQRDYPAPRLFRHTMVPFPLSGLGKANDLAGLPLLPPDFQAKLPSRDTAYPSLHHIGFGTKEEGTKWHVLDLLVK